MAGSRPKRSFGLSVRWVCNRPVTSHSPQMVLNVSFLIPVNSHFRPKAEIWLCLLGDRFAAKVGPLATDVIMPKVILDYRDKIGESNWRLRWSPDDSQRSPFSSSISVRAHEPVKAVSTTRDLIPCKFNCVGICRCSLFFMVEK